MRSSDGVLLYYPKVFLTHASPFFRDMCSISEHANDSNSMDSDQPLRMEEDAATLEELLQSIDPAKPTPPIKRETISKVFRAAHKYQIDKFIAHFTQSAAQELKCNCGTQTNSGALLSTDPMLVLSIAEQYKLPDLARLALRELISMPMNKLLTSKPGMSGKMWSHLLCLREARVNCLLEYINRFFQSNLQGRDQSTNSHLVVVTHVKLVNSEPSWHSIEAFLSDIRPQDSYSYSQNRVAPSPKAMKEQEGWKREINAIENRLPPLPQDIF